MDSIMLFGSHISWVVTELVSLILFFVCLNHMSKQQNAIHKLMEYFAFIILAGIFENIGVYVNDYVYDLHRYMMIGKVPLEVLIVEASILYAAFLLVDYLNIPTWSKPVVIGFLASVQDISLDPSAVYDMYLLDGKMSGQWNWTFRYDGGIAGIKYQNFSGWFTMMMFFATSVYVGRWLYEKYSKESIGFSYPFVAILTSLLLIVSPVNVFLIGATPIFPMNQEMPGLVMLIFKYFIAIVILIKYRKRLIPIDLKKDKLVYIIPITLHLFDVALAVILGIKKAYAPAVIVTIIHFLYLYYLYNNSKKSLVVSAI
ncbi:hypothetical protein [Flavobacterium notoginsengisoli]|uniref:hypothetical protein n=1 Tax=Flavobacterium notoginsengisoli TaxID=1478199 RepID=UPI0036375AC0